MDSYVEPWWLVRTKPWWYHRRMFECVVKPNFSCILLSHHGTCAGGASSSAIREAELEALQQHLSTLGLLSEEDVSRRSHEVS